jgi:hypothetical protein
MTNPYDNKFFANQNQKIVILKDYAQGIFDIYNPKSVVDVGCGPAHALSQFKTNGCDVLGLEFSLESASEFANENIKGYLEECDVTTWLDEWNHPRFDLAMSWHMAEHVPSQFSKRIVLGMTKLSDTIHWSAAPVGQQGINHINCQNPPYWERLFEELGYVVDQEATSRWYDPMNDKYGSNRQGKGIRDNVRIFVKA